MTRAHAVRMVRVRLLPVVGGVAVLVVLVFVLVLVLAIVTNNQRIQPVGSQTTTGISLAGHTWNLWKGPNSNWEVLSFVSQDGDITDFSADLNDFFG